MLENRKGIAFMVTYFIVAVFIIFAAIFVFRSIWEARSAEQYRQSMTAFYTAEAGIDKAIAGLPGDTSGQSNVPLTDAHGTVKGEYSYSIDVLEVDKRWRVESAGFVPNQANAVRARRLEAFIAKKDLPDNFWDNAIYTAGTIDINGNSYTVDGDILYGMGKDITHEDKTTGDITADPAINPLVRLDFENLRAISAAQNNVYDAARLNEKPKPVFPDSFWYDEDNGIPNVVYVEEDLILNGNIGTIGGFIIVVGNVLMDPDATQDTIINGNGLIDGCVYTTGEFRINGGGAPTEPYDTALNVYGGVWSGSSGVRINGSAGVYYNEEYMYAIRDNLPLSTIMQMVSFREVPAE